MWTYNTEEERLEQVKLAANFVTQIIMPRWKKLGYVPIGEEDSKEILDMIYTKKIHWNNAIKAVDLMYEYRIEYFGLEAYKEMMILLYGTR